MKKIGATKRPRETITPYELVRLKQCMSNKTRLEELGLPTAAYEFNTMAAMRNKVTSKYKDREQSVPAYDPADDSSGEGDTSDDNPTETSTKDAPKKRGKKRTSADMAPGGSQPRGAKKTTVSKRAAAAAQPTTRFTRLQKASPSEPDDVIQQQDDQVPLIAGECNETVLPDNNNNVANEGDECVQSDNEVQIEEEVRCVRGTNMGKGLQKITRARRARLPLVIDDGKTRPLVPLIAAKFATKCNITVRNHMPVLKHWKEYKNRRSVFLEQFMGKLESKFEMDKNDHSVQHACNEMMKSALRQQRHKLKKKFFDPYPLHLVPKTSPVKSVSDALWKELVEYWKDPKKMAACEKNKINHSKVKFHQTTGSRSYVVHLENLGDKYESEDPNVLDFFKECHYSKKKGYTAEVQSAITEMENKILESTEAEAKSVNNLVAEYLVGMNKNSKFLRNVGLEKVQGAVGVRKLEAQLAAEKSANADLQLLVSKQRDQIDVLSMKFQELEQARMADKAETDKTLELLLSRLNGV